MCAQLAAFGSVSECRERGKARARIKKELAKVKVVTRTGDGRVVYMNGNGHTIGVVEVGSKTPRPEVREDGSFGSYPRLWHLEASDEDSTRTSDSETTL